MTTYAPQTVPGRWISAAELSRESGLREDLVQRFMPADTSGPAPMYSAGAVPLAKYVKRLTDMGTPASAIDAAVRELHNNSGAMMQISLAPPEAPRRRGRIVAISGAAAAAALIIGGVVGGLVGSGTRDAAAPTAPTPVTVTAEAPPIDVSVPASADPVCAEWAPLAESYRAQRAAWVAIDPNIPGERWTPAQRSANMAVIPTLHAEADDLRRLAGKAQNDLLATLMRSQAQYEDAYANRLPNYRQSDQRLWQAVTDFGNSVNSVCTVTGPR